MWLYGDLLSVLPLGEMHVRIHLYMLWMESIVCGFAAFRLHLVCTAAQLTDDTWENWRLSVGIRWRPTLYSILHRFFYSASLDKWKPVAFYFVKFPAFSFFFSIFVQRLQFGCATSFDLYWPFWEVLLSTFPAILLLAFGVVCVCFHRPAELMIIGYNMNENGMKCVH